MMTFQFRAGLGLHTGESAWHFVTLPTDVADEIDDHTAGGADQPFTWVAGRLA